MAFTTIPSALINVGKALKRELFSTYIKDSLDDHESRITAVEGGAAKIQIFNGVVRNATSASTVTYLTMWSSPNAFSLLDCKIGLFDISGASLAGTLEIDIKKSTTDKDPSSYTTVFSTRPSIAMAGASSYDESSNTVFNPASQTVGVGDYIRLDITSLPSNGVLGSFSIYLIGETS